MLALLVTAEVAAAQECLEPGQAFENLGKYPEYVRRVLADAYGKDVVLRVLMLPSFSPEEVVGIRRRNQEYEVFCIAPRTAVWNTYSIKQIESGEMRTFDVNGKEVPPEKNEELQNLKKNAPSDYRQIKTQRWSRPIPNSLVERIIRLWQQMLLDARSGEDKRMGVDGETYEFAMPLKDHRVLTAEVWSPEEGSRTGALVKVANALSEYAKSVLDTQEFNKTLRSAVSRVWPNQVMQPTASRRTVSLFDD